MADVSKLEQMAAQISSAANGIATTISQMATLLKAMEDPPTPVPVPVPVPVPTPVPVPVPVPVPAPVPVPTPPKPAGTLQVRGRRLLDGAGNTLVVRGSEGWYGPTTRANLKKWVSDIAASGANAFRPQLQGASGTVLENLIVAFRAQGIISYLPDLAVAKTTATLLNKYLSSVVWDASIEVQSDADDAGVVDQWVKDSKALIASVRATGYLGLIGIGCPNSGRYLRGLLDHGAEILASDPLGNILFYWQAYWAAYGSNFSWQQTSGFTPGDDGISEAFAALAQCPAAIQVGIDTRDTGGNNADVNESLLLTLCAALGVGWLAWEWKDPDPTNVNDMVTGGADKPVTYTAYGQEILAATVGTKRPVI